jgi:hypothetical protein
MEKRILNILDCGVAGGVGTIFCGLDYDNNR